MKGFPLSKKESVGQRGGFFPLQEIPSKLFLGHP